MYLPPADTRGQNNFIFEFQGGQLIILLFYLFNVIFSITDDLFRLP